MNPKKIMNTKMKAMLLAVTGLTVTIKVAVSAPLIMDEPPLEGIQPLDPVVLIVTPRRGVKMSALNASHRAVGAKVEKILNSIGGVQIVQVPRNLAESIMAVYRTNSAVLAVETNAVADKRTAIPNDPLFLYQTNILVDWYGGGGNRITASALAHTNTGQKILLYANGILAGSQPASNNATANVLGAWDFVDSASNIVVAAVDSGALFGNPELASYWTNQLTGVLGISADDGGIHPHSIIISSNTADLVDLDGHGTRTLGIIVATPNNAIGSAGVAPWTKIMVCRVAHFSLGEVLVALEFAIENGADIINCPWGFDAYSPALYQAFKAARDANIICVCSTVNYSLNCDIYTNDCPVNLKKSPVNPGGLDNIFAVAAMGAGGVSYTSGYGLNTIDAMAPGVAVASIGINGLPQYGNGTSTSAAIAAGTAAEVLQYYINHSLPCPTPAQVIHLLDATADHGFDVGALSVSGGWINVGRALAVLDTRIVVDGVDSESGTVGLHLVGAVPGVVYTIQASADLTGPSWQSVTNIFGASPQFALSIGNAPEMYFRWIY